MPYSVLVERTIRMSRERFFARLADFGGLGKFLSSVERIEVKGEGIGCERWVYVKGMDGVVVERLDAIFDQRLLCYSVINDSPMPLDRYSCVIEVLDVDDPSGGCLVRWGSNWITKGATEAEIRTFLENSYSEIIDEITKAG